MKNFQFSAASPFQSGARSGLEGRPFVNPYSLHSKDRRAWSVGHGYGSGLRRRALEEITRAEAEMFDVLVITAPVEST